MSTPRPPRFPDVPNRISRFLACKRVAVLGVSRSGEGYGAKVYRLLRERGYQVVAVHPLATTLEGDPALPSLAAAAPLDGAVLVIPPEAGAGAVREAAAAGVPRIWCQPGAESDEILRLGAELGVEIVAGGCLLVALA